MRVTDNGVYALSWIGKLGGCNCAYRIWKLSNPNGNIHLGCQVYISHKWAKLTGQTVQKWW